MSNSITKKIPGRRWVVFMVIAFFVSVGFNTSDWITQVWQDLIDSCETPVAGIPNLEIEQRIVSAPIDMGINSINQIEFLFPQQSGIKAVSEERKALPLVIFAHGYLMKTNEYKVLSRHLLKEGYILAFPDIQGIGLTINLDVYAKNLAYLPGIFKKLNQDPESVLYRKWNGKYAMIGHSTGAGALVLAATSSVTNDNPPAVLIALAPLARNYGPIFGNHSLLFAHRLKIPSLIITTDDDCICPSTEHARTLFQSLENSYPRAMIQFNSGGHCGFLNQNSLMNQLCGKLNNTMCLFTSIKPHQKPKPQPQVFLLISTWLNYGFHKQPTNLIRLKEQMTAIEGEMTATF